ncbi:tRNA (adenosine(37)-N6)-threonylcarbamoyltransferase complex ATPase subunit type 1 TsaE [Altererythrobacter ishigakiensis]|uniref:tRNA threonylcarbamoyladenosine biosynthesis protein TsaE n=1 Tax=Altererythrobacter ishigakiensis TaxID=476157 RepID=A0A562UWA4_9SPHN|nr:tRNA (adenosine(37)-N6)-threonylcarbamoyltransferase complex ATPase subunit type 1 TsaE [Altererythrobacter ishigakiensis]TWJ09867.1 tRNA threonylcarbamoyladenosine biosynthesis protein TsaE [Altererythrobacter ishigakiensis]
MIVDLPDLDAMTAFSSRIARKVQAGDVISLEGELGTGKTTLARGILAGLGHDGEVPSPTFTIIETYENTKVPVAHADFYRLEDPSELRELGLDDYREGAVLIAEWPDKAGGFAHESACLAIKLEIAGLGRQAIVRGGREWQGRMP